MKFIDIIGLFGAFLSGITFFPQVYRTWKLKSAKELSMSMILIILLSNVLWLVYAFNKQDIAVISANFFVGSCAIVILYFKLKYK
jgi:MtN3 and saliva related transmembrane protein